MILWWIMKQIAETTKILDIHKYLIIKHSIVFVIKNYIKMRVINLLISLFSIIKNKSIRIRFQLLIKNARQDLKYLT